MAPKVAEVFSENASIIERMDISDRLKCSIAYAKAVRYHPDKDHYMKLKVALYQKITVVDGVATSNVHAAMQWMTKVIENAILLSLEELLFELVKEWCLLTFDPSVPRD